MKPKTWRQFEIVNFEATLSECSMNQKFFAYGRYFPNCHPPIHFLRISTPGLMDVNNLREH